MTRLAAPIIALAALATAATAASAGPTLEQVKKRGMLVCGSNPGIAGFGLPDG